MSDLSGVLNNRYYIIDTIGHGGMTTVYKALDVKTEKDVAIKVLAPYLVMDPVFKARFEREIKVLHQLDHPNIVPIIDFGEHGVTPYLVMPYFPKGTLTDRLRSGPLTEEECGGIINDISSALEYEHNRGIVHRDIKPSNILLDENGRAYLSDFDLVYMHDASQNLTGSAVIGTPAYMSPEQCNSGPIDARSDQYSLAIVLYQITTGHLPFYADTPIAIALQQINETLPNPRDFNPNIPEPIEAVLLKALSKDPDKRYPTIAAFNNAFQKALRISIITYQGNGTWTARYYEITQVLSRIQSKAKGWFLQSVLTKRYALIGVLVLLFIIPAIIFALLGSVRESSDASLKATISAIYTDVVRREGTPAKPGLLETVVAGTLEALNDHSEGMGSSGSPIPVTGGDPLEGTEFPDEMALEDFGTLETSSLIEGQLTPTPTPEGFPSFTPSPIPTSNTPAAQPSELTPSPIPSQMETWTPTATSTLTASPTPSLTNSPTSTSTSTPTRTNTPTATLTPSPTENVCANINLGGFTVKGVEVSYTLTNNSSVSITISSIYLFWPDLDEKQSLKLVEVGGGTVWNDGADESPTRVSNIGKDVGSKATASLSFSFKRAAETSGYSNYVTLSNGCLVSSSD